MRNILEPLKINVLKSGIKNPKKWIYGTFYGITPILLSYFIISLFLVLFNIETSTTDNMVKRVIYPAIQLFSVGFSVFLIVKFLGIINYIHWNSIKKRDIKYIIILITIMISIQLISGLLIQFLEFNVSENSVIEQNETEPIFFLYMIPVMILFVGPIEEFMYRGVLQGGFREHINTGIAVIISSMLFGLSHITVLGGFSVESIPYIITVFVLGGVLGIFYEYRENLIVPAVAHGIYNSIILVISYIQVTNDVSSLYIL